MEIKVDVQTDIAKALARFAWIGDAGLPAIVAHGLNKTAVGMRGLLRKEVARVFDRPTPYTLNAFYTKPATVNDLSIEIRLKDSFDKGIPAAAYLAPEVYGGDRAYKRFEKALANAGILPSGLFAVPAKGFGLDQYGNFPKATLVSILSFLRAFGETGYLANRTAKSTARRKAQYFAVTPKNRQSHSNLPFGIYQRTGKGIKMVIAFVKKPHYRQRLDFFGVAQQAINRFLVNDITEVAERANERSKDALLSSITDLANVLNTD